MFRGFLILAVGLIVLQGCATTQHQSGQTAPPFASLPQEHQDIYLAVLRHMFAYCKGRRFGPPDRFLLRIGNKDAPADLLLRLRSEGYDVLPASRYRRNRGVECSLQELEGVSASRAKVSGGYGYAALGGAWGYFHLRKEHGQWRVVSWTPEVFA